eukprot:TRINITY_DN25274_c0_g1_i1.p1 TRINITY_DN25274_c0_g1~~TRINITY_DN25274_c0_g1_i1.p1  ORF type:complete len:485 (+),score=109.83 TRINITY_DN25274_c0_g1_i1:60-1457(+)
MASNTAPVRNNFGKRRCRASAGWLCVGASSVLAGKAALQGITAFIAPSTTAPAGQVGGSHKAARSQAELPTPTNSLVTNAAPVAQQEGDAAMPLPFLLAAAASGALTIAGKQRHNRQPRAAETVSRKAGEADTRTGDSDMSFDFLLPRVLLLFMAGCCSTNFTFLKILGTGHSEAVVAAVRFLVACVPFLPLLPKHMNRTSIISGVEIGLWCTLGYISQAMGLQTTEASTGAFLCSLAMVVVPVVKSITGHPVANIIWVAVALAVSGTGFLTGFLSNPFDSTAAAGAAAAAAGGPGMGEILCAVTAVGFGLMFARMDDYAKEEDFDVMGCTIWQVITLTVAMMVWAVLACGPAGAMSEATGLLTGGFDVLGPLLWVGIVTTAGVLYIETWCMERMDGAEAGVIFASEPVWATLFASQMLGETFGLTEGIGSFLILSACLLTQVGGDESKETEEEEATAGLQASSA